MQSGIGALVLVRINVSAIFIENFVASRLQRRDEYLETQETNSSRMLQHRKISKHTNKYVEPDVG